MSDSEDSRILEPAGGDSDGELEPGAGHDDDAQLLDDVDLGAVGGDAPDGLPDEAQDDEPVGAALPPLLASLGGRTIRVRLLLEGAPVLAPPGLLPLRVNPACPHCHTIPMVSGRCCSNVGERKPCPKCQSLLWPGEKGKCCRDGKEVLGPDLNPPIDAPYLALLKELHFSHNSRLINSQLAMGSQGTFPSRDVGGLGFHDQPAAFLHLFGKSYLVMRNPRHNNSNIDNFLLPHSSSSTMVPSRTWGSTMLGSCAVSAATSRSTTPLPGACVWWTTWMGSALTSVGVSVLRPTLRSPGPWSWHSWTVVCAPLARRATRCCTLTLGARSRTFTQCHSVPP